MAPQNAAGTLTGDPPHYKKPSPPPPKAPLTTPGPPPPDAFCIIVDWQAVKKAKEKHKHEAPVLK